VSYHERYAQLVKATDYAALVADPARYLDHADAQIRRLAVSACVARLDDPATTVSIGRALEQDESPRVRAEAAEALGFVAGSVEALMRATTDPEGIVREAVATALGERADVAALPWLISAVDDDPDRLVREAAIAALGAIGHPGALPVLLRIVASGAPQLRRRAVVALTVFDTPEAEAALRAAAHDRNPMVREAAEMVVGRAAEWQSVPLVDPPH